MTKRARALTDWARTYVEVEADPVTTREKLRAFARQHGYEPDQIERAVDNALRIAKQEATPA